MYEFTASGLFHRLYRIAFWLAHLPILLAFLWAVGLVICQPLCALMFLPFLIAAIWRARKTGTIQFRRWIAFFCAAEGVLFYFLPGPHDEAWELSKARTPDISLRENGILHIANIHDFTYRSAKDFDLRYLEEDFNPQEIDGVFLAESRHDSGACDLMLSFAFKDGRYLVVSPEMRLPAGQVYNDIRAHYKNYGLIYLFGTEEDIFLQRTDIRKEYLLLYPLKADVKQATAMLMLCARLAQDAARNNTAYNPLKQSYANDLLNVLHVLHPELPHRLMPSKDVAALLYHRGLINTDLRGDWSQVKHAFAAGFNFCPAMREDYSDLLRQKLNLTRRSNKPERHIQEQVAGSTLRYAAAPAAVHRQERKQVSAEDIPELSERLERDRQRSAAVEAKTESTSEKEEEAPAPATPQSDRVFDFVDPTREANRNATGRPRTAADNILELGDRLSADARREEEDQAKLEQQEQKAAEGHDLLDNADEDNEHQTRFEEAFFGKKKSGITIIEKPKPKEEAHPLDPIRKQKRKTPFDEEDKKKQDQDGPQEEDPFAPKPPINI